MRQPTACIKLERARRAGPKPARGAASAMSPSLTLLPCPAGQPPFEAHRGNTSAAPGAATLSAHRRVSTPYPLSGVVSGAVLPPGHKSRSHCRALRLLRHRMRCGRCDGSCCGSRFKSPAKSNLLWCCVPRRGIEARDGRNKDHISAVPLFKRPAQPMGSALCVREQCGSDGQSSRMIALSWFIVLAVGLSPILTFFYRL